jgi:hypothetical protein
MSSDLLALELEAFVETVDRVEGAQDGGELDVDDAVLVRLIELDLLDGTELDVVSAEVSTSREHLPWR